MVGLDLDTAALVHEPGASAHEERRTSAATGTASAPRCVRLDFERIEKLR